MTKQTIEEMSKRDFERAVNNPLNKFLDNIVKENINATIAFDQTTTTINQHNNNIADELASSDMQYEGGK